MTRNTEIARVSGGASGHIWCDTQKQRAGSAPILSTTILTRTSAKTYRRSSGSRPAALRSGIYPGESRGEVGQGASDAQWVRADLAHLPASAGAIPTIEYATPTTSVSGLHLSVHKDGRSANSFAKPVDPLPSAPIPSNGSPPTNAPQTLKVQVSAGNHSASADRTEGASHDETSGAEAPPPSACSPKGGGIDQRGLETQPRSVDPAFITPTTDASEPRSLASACKSGATVVSQTPISTAWLPTIRSSAGRAGSTEDLVKPIPQLSIPQPFTAEAYP